MSDTPPLPAWPTIADLERMRTAVKAAPFQMLSIYDAQLLPVVNAAEAAVLLVPQLRTLIDKYKLRIGANIYARSAQQSRVYKEVVTNLEALWAPAVPTEKEK